MILNAENLALTLSGKTGKPEKKFRDVSFEISEGETGLVSGRSGSGKTLLGLSLCGFLPLWVGDWNLDGKLTFLGKPLIQGEIRNETGIVLENPYSQISGLKQIEITSGSATFYVLNKKIITENLAIWGDVISIQAKGYLGFDKELNFEVENKMNKPKAPQEDVPDWQVGLQEVLIGMGKFLAKSYLTGTLDKPKWKYQYFDGVKNILGGSLGEAFKGIFE